jgi:hypothetical protein
MERPPGWRIETTTEFEQDFARLSVQSERLGQYRESWEWYLQRVPDRFSSGLTSETDNESRVMAWIEPRDGIEYVAGLTLDYDRHLVQLRWLDSRELLSDS